MCRFCQMEARNGEGCFEEESSLSDSGFGELICKYTKIHLLRY